MSTSSSSSVFDSPLLQADVVILGGGNAALCAAICAREQGASVIVLESAPWEYRGGNSRHTRNLRGMHEAPTTILTDTYSEQEYFEDLWRVTGGRTNEALARMVIASSARSIEWMRAHGVRFQPALSGTLQLGRTNAFFLGGGKALMNTYYELAQRLGVQIFYNAEVVDLQIEDGRFIHASFMQNGLAGRAFGQTLVAAAGGFEANLLWLRKVWGAAADNFIVRGTPYNKGKVLELLLACGAHSIGDEKQCHAVAIDARAPKFDGGIVTRLDCVPLGVVVNQNGERFYDEGEDFWPKRYAVWGRLVADQPGQIAYSITDAKMIGQFMPSVFPAVQAESVSQLAQALDLPTDPVVTTISAFNAGVRLGTFDPTVLDDCSTSGLTPNKSHWAVPIDTPPFFGYPLRPGITFTYLGIEVDRGAAIIMSNGARARNIFAAGEIMAGNILGQGYLAGIGMTIGTVFGQIAGEKAAEYALR